MLRTGSLEARFQFQGDPLTEENAVAGANDKRRGRRRPGAGGGKVRLRRTRPLKHCLAIQRQRSADAVTPEPDQDDTAVEEEPAVEVDDADVAEEVVDETIGQDDDAILGDDTDGDD